MAAYAAVVSLMNNIEQMVIHPRLSTSFDNNYIQPLVEKAGFLLDFIEGCFSHGGGGNKEDLERRITSAAYAAEDVIESHIVDQIQAGSSEVSLTCSLELQQIIQDIDAIIIEAAEEKEGWSKQEKSTHAAAEPLIESGDTTGMVGLDDELSKLLHEVTWDQSSRRIVSIVGMGGTGKTTLATHIYHHALIKQRFDIRAWATISQRYNAENILSKLLSSIGNSTSASVDALGEELHKALCGRRYLIVIDDIWSVQAWDHIRRFFPAQNGSRVVLTTRLSSVATDCGSSFELKLDLLHEDRSWKLFCHKASFPQKDDPPQLEDVGKVIVESCKGLALSIAVIGGLLLKSPRTVEYWNSVAKDMKSIRALEAKQESLDVLSLSYSHLPPHLKPCFLYMGVFDEDSEIRVQNLIKLWVAEGFIKLPNGSSRELEEVAEGYMKDLIDRNLILVGRRSSSGKIKICGFHDLLRDLSLKIANEEMFFHLHFDGMQGSYRRIIKCGFLDPTKVPPLLRSILTTSDELLVKQRLLRVLDNAFYKGKKCYLDKNVNLRYLDYRLYSLNTYEIPSSFSRLWNLQSLIIDLGFEKVIVMTDEFWKMRQLRHVKCERIYLPDPRRGEGLKLDKLQTLKGVVNLILSEEVCNIISNIKKLYLSYDSKSHGYDKSFHKFLCNTDRLHELESLNMMFELGNMTACIRNTHLIYEFRFPSSLKKLTLEICGRCWEFMEEIGSLPHLEVLKLEFFSLTNGDHRWRPVDDQFLRLKFLKIRCCYLYEWDAESSHFPALEKLVLIDVYGLREIPSSFDDLGTLQLIHVQRCSEDAAVSAIRIKERRMEDDPTDALQIQVAVDDSNLESFMERLKMEELTLENIRFKDPYSDEIW